MIDENRNPFLLEWKRKEMKRKKKRKHIRRLFKGFFRLMRTLLLVANVVLVLRAVQILIELKERDDHGA